MVSKHVYLLGMDSVIVIGRSRGAIVPAGTGSAKRNGIAHHHFSLSPPCISRETLIKSLSDFTLEFLCIARNNLTRIASYLRKAMTKLCIKILVKADSAIESAFPYGKVPRRGG